MRITDKDEEIQKYLQGDLSPEELEKFEQKLAKDTDLAAEVKDYENLVKGLEAIGLDHFKSEVQDWETEYLDNRAVEEDVKTPAKVISFKKYIPMAAAVIALLIAGIYFYIDRNPAVGTLYAEYYQPYPDMLTDRGDSITNKPGLSLLYAGIEAYNYKNFQLAVENLQAYIEVKPDQKGVALYLAISQMELDQFDLAAENFRIAGEDPAFKQQAQWYEALLNLKAGKPLKSQTILKTIVDNPTHYRREEAMKLLNSLE